MFGITFAQKPHNFKQIDNLVSRSAQPKKANIKWLKKHGVTDVINFCNKGDIKTCDEQALVEKAGMHYHNIPTDPRHPSERKVGEFLDLVEGIKENGGKVHIHCHHGADRTGMYSWIYKQKHGIGEMRDNEREMIKMGHDRCYFPQMINWIKEYLYKGWK